MELPELNQRDEIAFDRFREVVGETHGAPWLTVKEIETPSLSGYRLIGSWIIVNG